MRTDRMVGIVDRDRALQRGLKGLPDIKSLRLPTDKIDTGDIMRAASLEASTAETFSAAAAVASSRARAAASAFSDASPLAAANCASASANLASASAFSSSAA